MAKAIFIFIVTLFSLSGFSQDPNKSDTSLNAKKTLTKHYNGADIVLGNVRYPPEFPGGKAAWVDFLKRNIDIRIPFMKNVIPGTYVVSVRFTVGRDSSLRNIGAESGCGYGMEDEVIKSLKLSPKWKPAQTSYKEVVSFATRQLVIFKIKGTDIQVEIR